MSRKPKFRAGQVVMYGELPVKLQRFCEEWMTFRWEATDGGKYLEISLRPLTKLEAGVGLQRRESHAK